MSSVRFSFAIKAGASQSLMSFPITDFARVRRREDGASFSLPLGEQCFFCLFLCFCTTLELATVGYVFRKTNLYASSRKWILSALSFYTEPLLSAHKANLGRFLFSIYRTFQLIGQWCVSFFSFFIPSLSDLEYHCLKS